MGERLKVKSPEAFKKQYFPSYEEPIVNFQKC